MASPYIKQEANNTISNHPNHHFRASQPNAMAQHGFNHMGGAGGIDPNDLNMGGTFNPSFQNSFNSNQNNSTGFSSGSALLQDDELFDGLSSPTDAPSGIHANGQDF